jgi:peroxiredoxin
MIYFIIFLSFFLNVGCLDKNIIKNDSDILWPNCSYNLGDHACNFSLLDQKEEYISLYDFYERPIVLDFSTGWCGFCGIAAKEAQSVQDKYASYGLIYITVMIEDHKGRSPDSEFCEDWAQAFNILSAPVLAGSNKMISDNPDNGWEVTAYPTFFLIDRDMIIRNEIIGFSPQMLDDYIQNIIH